LRESKATFFVAQEIKECLNNSKSFAYETNFTVHKIPNFLINAKKNGYIIILHYIATDSYYTNIERIKNQMLLF